MTTRGNSDAFAGRDQLRTPGDWLEFAEELYENHHVALGQVATNAHDEALYLILRALDLPLDSEPDVLALKLTATQRRKLEETFRRRVFDRVPAAYLTREAWLGEHRFYVDERVIIPRSYFLEIIPRISARRAGTKAGGGAKPAKASEPLVDVVIDGPVQRVADVCTGSGCLAILLAHRFPQAKVDAVDLSAEALSVARINVDQHRVTSRVALYESDVFDAVPPVRYDVILSNPPYEPSMLVDAQEPEFAAEPRMAHDGGADGLVIIRKLLCQAKDRLTPHGIVVIEVGGLHEEINREFASLKPRWIATEDESNCVVLFEARHLARK